MRCTYDSRYKRIHTVLLFLHILRTVFDTIIVQNGNELNTVSLQCYDIHAIDRQSLQFVQRSLHSYMQRGKRISLTAIRTTNRERMHAYVT